MEAPAQREAAAVMSGHAAHAADSSTGFPLARRHAPAALPDRRAALPGAAPRGWLIGSGSAPAAGLRPRMPGTAAARGGLACAGCAGPSQRTGVVLRRALRQPRV